MSRKNKQQISGKHHPYIKLILLCIAVIVIYCIQLYATDQLPDYPPDNELGLYFIDSDQGDSALITVPGGSTVMIDTGLYENRVLLVEYIKSLGIKQIDYLILSHPHSDHIGGASEVIENFKVKNVIMPDTVSDSPLFEKVLISMKDNNVPLKTLGNGDKFNIKDAKFTVISSNADYGDGNNSSLVIRLDYKNCSFLFTGDAEKESENEILNGKYRSLLDTDVIKVGHHGSSTSSSEEFLSAVTPKYAIISCGKNNEYGHPHRTTIQNLQNIGASIFRTDKHGTIVMTCDGDNIKVLQPEKR